MGFVAEATRALDHVVYVYRFGQTLAPLADWSGRTGVIPSLRLNEVPRALSAKGSAEAPGDAQVRPEKAQAVEACDDGRLEGP